MQHRVVGEMNPNNGVQVMFEQIPLSFNCLITGISQ